MPRMLLIMIGAVIVLLPTVPPIFADTMAVENPAKCDAVFAADSLDRELELFLGDSINLNTLRIEFDEESRLKEKVTDEIKFLSNELTNHAIRKYRRYERELKDSPENPALKQKIESLKEVVFYSYIRVALFYVGRFARRNSTRVDRVSIAIQALLEAMKGFDVDYGSKFGSYLIEIVRCRVLDVETSPKRYKEKVFSTIDGAHGENGESYRFSRTILDHRESRPENIVVGQEQRTLVRQAVESLAPLEIQVIEMLYGLGENGERYTIVEVARKLGMTNQRTKMVVKTALGKLKEGISSGK